MFIGPKLTENSATDPGGGMVGGVVVEVHLEFWMCVNLQRDEQMYTRREFLHLQNDHACTYNFCN